MLEYPIGYQTTFCGEKIKITTKPYNLYGGEWQDGITNGGIKVTVKSPYYAAKSTFNALKKYYKEGK